MITGLGHSTTSEKSSPYLHQGTFSTHMVPDLARWQNSLGGKLPFGASERPLNHPGADLDDPIVPELEDGAHWDGQILPFYMTWWTLTVPICSILRHKHYRIDEIILRAVQGRFRCFEKQHTSHTELPVGKIVHHMGQNAAHALAWGALFRNGALVCTSDRCRPI